VRGVEQFSARLKKAMVTHTSKPQILMITNEIDDEKE
jgi:hypothetical protein